MNPRLPDPRLFDHHDFERNSGLPLGYFDDRWLRHSARRGFRSDDIADRIIVGIAVIGIVSGILLYIGHRVGWVPW